MNYTFLLVLAVFAIFIAAPVSLVAAARENRRRNAIGTVREDKTAGSSFEPARRSSAVPAGTGEVHRNMWVALQRLETATRLPENDLRLEASEGDGTQWSRVVTRALDWSASHNKEQAKA